MLLLNRPRALVYLLLFGWIWLPLLGCAASLQQAVGKTQYTTVLQAKAKKIYLLDTATGQVVSQKRLSYASFASVQLLLKDLRADDRYEAIVVAKRSSSRLKVYLISVNTTNTKLTIRDTLTVNQDYVVPGNTTIKSKSIRLRNNLEHILARLSVSSQYHLALSNHDELTTLVVLGDDKVSTTTPQVGYVYLCNAQSGGGGAFSDGPWIDGDYWDYSEKNVTVDGTVTWSNADVTVTSDGTNRSLVSNGLPINHTTGAFPVSSSDDAYDYDRNPNTITEQSYHITVPAVPTESSAPNCLGGEVGISLTGVPIFNALDATGRDAVAHEIQDTYGGHPQESGMYHYHTISDVVAALDASDGHGMTLVGYAFDGFGIYGEEEYGETLRTDDLDTCHGHSHTITWDDEVELYHYHVTKDYPYTVGCFRGESVLSNGRL